MLRKSTDEDISDEEDAIEIKNRTFKKHKYMIGLEEDRDRKSVV